ncbi:MAG: HDIG domain-containing protein [Chloroflexota bacterium]|nr:MAG: HDIG domain-containing protein [Chloroflexota bacterium]
MSASPKITRPALYRASQFFAAVKAVLLPGGLTQADEALVTAILTAPAQQRLFARMSPNDRRHALAVVRTLQQAGYEQPALLQAALLHDVAKSLGQPILHRVAIVLLKAFWPAALERICEWRTANGEWRARIEDSSIRLFAYSPIPYWRRPFVIHAHHPAIGAAWVEEAGCDPLAVRLIARHQETLTGQPAGEEEKLLAALQWADNLN